MPFVLFACFRRTDVLEKSTRGRAELPEIAPRLREAKIAIGAASHFTCVRIILTIIFPKTNRADLKTSAL